MVEGWRFAQGSYETCERPSFFKALVLVIARNVTTQTLFPGKEYLQVTL